MQSVRTMDRPTLEARSEAFAVAVFALCRQIREEACGRALADQLARCATAVAANYRATSRARSNAEFLAKLSVVAEESDETVFWLEFATRTGLGNQSARAALLAEARELRAIFAASCRTVRRASRPRGRRR